MDFIRSIKVLLIEDNPGDARLISEITKEITEEQIELVHASKLGEGLKLLQKQKFDIILLNLMLPDAIGLEPIQKIKNQFKNIPIIIVSGNSDKEIAAKAIEIGAQEFILKLPYEPDMFSRFIRSAIIRQKKEENLRKTTQLLDTIVDNTDTNLAILDTELKYIFVNKSYSETDGREQSFFLGKNLLDVYPIPGFKEVIQEINNTKKPVYAQSVPFVHTNRPDRNITYWDCSLVPILNAEGKITSYLLSAREVTVKAEYENKLSYQALLLSKVRDAIYATDTKFNITSWNKAAEYLYGWKAEEVIGKRLFDVIESPFIVKEVQEAANYLNKKGYYSTEIELKKKDDTNIYIEGNIIQLKDKDGSITGYVFVNHDITERKQIEIQLRKERDNFKILLNSTDIMFVEISPQQNVLFLNKKLCEILECREDEYIGKNWFDCFIPGDFIQKTKSDFNRIINEEISNSDTFIYPIVSNNKIVKIVSWKQTIIKDENAKIASVFLSGTEVSE